MAIGKDESRARDLVEVFGYLACLGPEAFEPDTARSLIAAHSGGKRAELVAEILHPEQRDAVSRELGALLADRLVNRGPEGSRGIATLLPCFLAVDAEIGFGVLRYLALALSRVHAPDMAEVVLSLTIAEGQIARGAMKRPEDDADVSRSLKSLGRLRYLVSVMAALDLDPTGRARLFLALSQSLEDLEVMRAMVLTSLFPAGSAEGMAVLTSGNDDALRALLEGSASRPKGKSEFYAACKATMDLGLAQGLPTLGRVYRLLSGPPEQGSNGPGLANLRAMASMVRAPVLLAVEAAATTRRGLVTQLPESPDVWTLHLLALIAPGVKEPNRSSLCEYLVDRGGMVLRTGRLDDAAGDALVQVLVGASVLHARPESMGSEVRRTILDAMGAMHVRLQSSSGPSEDDLDAARTFQRAVAAVGHEFRRRQALASSLAQVLPLVAGLTGRAEGQTLPAWAE